MCEIGEVVVAGHRQHDEAGDDRQDERRDLTDRRDVVDDLRDACARHVDREQHHHEQDEADRDVRRRHRLVAAEDGEHGRHDGRRHDAPRDRGADEARQADVEPDVVTERDPRVRERRAVLARPTGRGGERHGEDGREDTGDDVDERRPRARDLHDGAGGEKDARADDAVDRQQDD